MGYAAPTAPDDMRGLGFFVNLWVPGLSSPSRVIVVVHWDL